MKKINTYSELFMALKDANEFAEELRADSEVKTVKVIEGGDGWWVEWTE